MVQVRSRTVKDPVIHDICVVSCVRRERTFRVRENELQEHRGGVAWHFTRRRGSSRTPHRFPSSVTAPQGFLAGSFWRALEQTLPLISRLNALREAAHERTEQLRRTSFVRAGRSRRQGAQAWGLGSEGWRPEKLTQAYGGSSGRAEEGPRQRQSRASCLHL